MSLDVVSLLFLGIYLSHFFIKPMKANVNIFMTKKCFKCKIVHLKILKSNCWSNKVLSSLNWKCFIINTTGCCIFWNFQTWLEFIYLHRDRILNRWLWLLHFRNFSDFLSDTKCASNKALDNFCWAFTSSPKGRLVTNFFAAKKSKIRFYL